MKEGRLRYGMETWFRKRGGVMDDELRESMTLEIGMAIESAWLFPEII